MKKKFICATREYAEFDKHIPAPYLRKSFTLAKKAEIASISICGLGFYMLYVNGKNITKGHIAPYISNPDDVCYYDTYDVAELLCEGENVIGIILGNGMNNCPGGIIWDFDKADFRSSPRVALEFSARVGEESVSFDATEGFLTHPSPILFDELRGGEIYDARLEIPGWNLPGFVPKDWKAALPAETPRGKMKECTAEPIKTMYELEPVSIRKVDGYYIYDFGVNTAGVPVLKIKGEEGQLVTLTHFEMLGNDGKFYNNNIAFDLKRAPHYAEYNQTDRFYCSGGEDVYSPSFCYHGFRYIKVEGITEEQATKALLTYRVMSSELKSIGHFSCSDERLNTLYRMIDNANRSNFFYFPTDCPHREKNGWTGDAAISAEQMTLQYDTERSYREWLTSIRLAQNEEGALPGIVPTSGWGFAWGNGPTWDQVLFRLPYVLYKFRGCTDVIRENAHAMVRYLEYALTRRSENGTIAIGLGDWVPVDKRSSQYDAPLALTDTVAVMEMARAAAEMFTAVGYTHRAAFADAIYKDMRDTIRRELVDLETMVVAGECQSSQAISLYYGVFDESEKAAAVANLVKYIHAKDDAFDCGFIGMHCIFHVLSDAGEQELAFKMITRDKFPSYTWLIDKGFTAMPEQFLSYDGDDYWSSKNHHFLGDVSRWFVTSLAGLEIIDCKTVRINPRPVASIDFAKAYYDLPLGRVTVSWERGANGEPIVSYTAPEGVKIIK